ncbi:hypothetical protein DB30_01252 [Enhygromyxa salina]|uniref:Uncharacterized protein n=1 Tax=Enhygromyxa salina TaxID=215803 RepID=A0A0C2CXI1_9BACT|nr:hypothetical protein [Enhygromyxa salina]KIG12542.1 hypothetical protein DB30_01252 [Enhygromyxa salina]
MEADVPFQDKLWDQWLEAVARPTTESLMICAWGATAPNNQQWRRANKQMRDQALAVAVVTEARHNAALAKAASWLGTNIKSFRWGELHNACEFVGYERTERLGARTKITALRDRFGTVTADETAASGHSTPLLTAVSPDAISASGALVRETNDEIQTRLAEVQERLRSRTTFSRSGS